MDFFRVVMSELWQLRGVFVHPLDSMPVVLNLLLQNLVLSLEEKPTHFELLVFIFPIFQGIGGPSINS